MLVASLALSVGLVIYDLFLRGLSLSQIATQSQYAIYAADTGAECALYWDIKYRNNYAGDLDGSAFATSSNMLSAETGGGAAAGSVVCNGIDIVSNSYNAALYYTGSPCGSTVTNSWCVLSGANYATTTFYISSGASASAPCAKIEIGKYGYPAQTTLVSHGYNTCVSANTLRLERTLQVNY